MVDEVAAKRTRNKDVDKNEVALKMQRTRLDEAVEEVVVSGSTGESKQPVR